MKKLLIFAAAAMLLILAGCSAGNNAAQDRVATQQPTEATSDKMTVTSSGIARGIIDPAYGMKGKEIINGIPTLSIPLEIKGAPEGTKTYAVYMDDADSVPLCGYRWVHWMLVNVENNVIPEDFSQNAGNAVQGANDFDTIGYGGPTPPDKNHTYRITVYALDTKLSLAEGFSKEAFQEAIKEHVLASASLEAVYEK